jgi:hypothetical protein
LAVQLSYYLFNVFADIGFDTPGRFGLDYGHVIVASIISAAATLAGWGYCVVRMAWLSLMLLLNPIACFALILCGVCR